MRNVERKLYQKNKLGNLFVLLFIVLNIIYSITMLNNMPINYHIGIFVFITIMLLLLGFLTGIKLESYSKPWAFVAIALGMFQISRVFFGEYTLEPTDLFIQKCVLVASGASAIIGGLVTIQFTNQRNEYINSQKTLDN